MLFWKKALLTTTLLLSTSVNAALIDSNNIVRIDYDLRGQSFSSENIYIRMNMLFGPNFLDAGDTFDYRVYNSDNTAITDLRNFNLSDFFSPIGSGATLDNLYQGLDIDAGYYQLTNITGSFELVDNVTITVLTNLADIGPVSGSITVLPSAIPIPAAAWLFGSGLIGLLVFARQSVN